MFAKWILKAIVKFTAMMNAVATAWTFLLMFFMTADVLGRVLFNHPLTGAPELVKVSLVGLVYLHLPNTLWVGRHIRSEMILSRLKPRLKKILLAFWHLLGSGLFVGIVVSAWPYMMWSWGIGEYEGEGALRVPTAPIRTIVILGSVMTAFIFMVRFAQGLIDLIANRKEAA